jgi:hypothetical protein
VCASSAPPVFARGAAARLERRFGVCLMGVGSIPLAILGAMAAVGRRAGPISAHFDQDPGNNRLPNLRSLRQRCHIIHDRPYHLAQRRITYLLRRALGDLFLGPYCRTAPTVCSGKGRYH